MLRERLAMIDLETTPMVPIPPPETRVGVPPVPEARAAPPPSHDDDDEPTDPEAPATRRIGGRRSTRRHPSRQSSPFASPFGCPPGRRPSRRRRTRRRARAPRRAAIWSARSRPTGARLRSRRSPPCAPTTWWRTRACCSRAATSRPRAASSRPARGARPRPRRRHRAAGRRQLPTQDWTRARELYALLEAAPDAADVIPRELLVQRRAALADRLGDAVEAEALYRELAILNPQHVGRAQGAGRAGARARRSAERGPAPGGGPAPDRRRTRPATCSTSGSGSARSTPSCGEWDSARHYLELVVAQDPARAPALELLLEAYDQLDMPAAAAARLRAAGPPLLRAVAARGRPVSPGGDPAHAARQPGGGAGRLPALVGSRSPLRPGAPAPRRSLLERRAISTSSPSSPTTWRPSRCRRTDEPDLVARLAIATTTLRARRHAALPVHAPALAHAGGARDRRGGGPPGAATAIAASSRSIRC